MSPSDTKSMIPAFLIAGTHSGVGKTTVTLGLMAALRARGLDVQPFKVGPDFIDPSHHTAVCGRPSRNLDPFMMGEMACAAPSAQLSPERTWPWWRASWAFTTAWVHPMWAAPPRWPRSWDIPVLLVINVHGMSRSAAAMEMGFSKFDPGVRLAGTILNRVGSERHLAMLKNPCD